MDEYPVLVSFCMLVVGLFCFVFDFATLTILFLKQNLGGYVVFLMMFWLCKLCKVGTDVRGRIGLLHHCVFRLENIFIASVLYLSCYCHYCHY